MTLFESNHPADRQAEADPFASVRSRRQRNGLASALGVVLALAGAAVLIIGPAQVAMTASRWFTSDTLPAQGVIELADRSFLTKEGRVILYDARTRLVGREEIGDVCPIFEGGANALGCFSLLHGIYIYEPGDTRLADMMVTTLTHEMLHAAYALLAADDLAAVNGMLVAEIARVPADDAIHDRITLAMRGSEAARGTETFALLGTEVHPDGGLAPELEAVYARYISDRAALVGVYEAFEPVIQGIVDETQRAIDQLAADESANADGRARWEVDRATHEAERQRYAIDADRYNALPEAERGNWSVSWTTPDGLILTQPLGASLATRLAQLEAFRADLDARAAALTEAEAELSARRSHVEAQLADTNALLEAAYPGQTLD
ncbi:MAG TPA: hypothetical protein VNT50_14085 [Microbacterium sp.]|uniref:hypothetical protein n=1 Tax=Microbacterium sp. TaxID=51671 RepID=UPI002CF59B76|nr:hypothetical protein [Microbacterium sp.]HWI32610.1 hypothetical protein [Microbacterium sp.]